MVIISVLFGAVAMYDWRGTFSVHDEKQLLILFFSVRVGSWFHARGAAVEQW